MSLDMRSYKQVASEWFLTESAKGNVGEAEKRGAMLFADHLDKSHLGADLQVLALQAGRDVDRECMKALIDAIGNEKAREILEPILLKNRATKG